MASSEWQWKDLPHRLVTGSTGPAGTSGHGCAPIDVLWNDQVLLDPMCFLFIWQCGYLWHCRRTSGDELCKHVQLLLDHSGHSIALDATWITFSMLQGHRH